MYLIFPIQHILLVCILFILPSLLQPSILCDDSSRLSDETYVLYGGKIWQALNLANWLSVGTCIGGFNIWRSELLAP